MVPLPGTALTPIPWAHSTTDFGSVWEWETPHFIVTVTGNERSCYYRIMDKSSGEPKPYADGQTASFAQAEKLIRATIGKAYPPVLGYGEYAGHLATTFMLGTGEEADLAVYVGRPIVVEVNDHGTVAAYRGIGGIDCYYLTLSVDGETLLVNPNRITSIRPADGVRTSHTRGSSAIAGRAYQGDVVRGCTGSAGFIPGTVEHFGLPCPIHEG